MSTQLQSKYIADLAVLKTKEFKEVKELLTSNNIVVRGASTVNNAGTIAEITHELTDLQASMLINTLIETKEPARGQAYSKKRVESTIAALDGIKASIAGWGF
jgi:hypothetical protein